MHGDLRHEEHIVVTKRDYDSYMDRYPVVATHLSAMLITRTPMFLGYSLSDPDFENIRKIVRSRLGVFERMAYVIQFDIDPRAIETALDERLHIISLNTSSGMSRSDILASFFSTIQTQLDAKGGVTLRSSRPDLFEDVETEIVQNAVQTPQQSPLIETTSRLCFVMMPFGERFDEVYRMLISPVATDNGMTTLRADEMAGPGFIIEQIRTAVQQSRLCIADLTGANPNVLYEVGYTQAAGKPLILLAEEGSHLPFDIAHVRVIFYGSDLEAAQSLLRRAISIVLSSSRLEEAIRLFDLKQYRGAIAAGAVVLEQRLREALAQRPPEKFARMGLGQMLRLAARRKVVAPALAAQLADVVAIRNRAVHDLTELTEGEAKFVVDTIRQVLDVLPQQ
jgi:SIR2-like domain